jgi:Ni,Fe-hydrogenase III component G
MSEIYRDLPGSEVLAETALLMEQGCRLAATFAEDRAAAEACYFVYYVFEQPDNPSYLLLRTAVSPQEPVFPSVAARIPAANWQEREIQDNRKPWQPGADI